MLVVCIYTHKCNAMFLHFCPLPPEMRRWRLLHQSFMQVNLEEMLGEGRLLKLVAKAFPTAPTWILLTNDTFTNTGS